jgi:hypothetical protein
VLHSALYERKMKHKWRIEYRSARRKTHTFGLRLLLLQTLGTGLAEIVEQKDGGVKGLRERSTTCRYTRGAEAGCPIYF